MVEALILHLISIVVLLFLSAFFSSSETALTSVNKIRVTTLAKEGDKRAKILQSIIDKPSKLLSTLLVGNNVVNVALSVVFTSLCITYFGAKGIPIATVALSLLILIFGEITPKTYAAVNADTMSLTVARPMKVIMGIVYPIVHITAPFTRFLIKIMGGNLERNSPVVSEEEIKMMVDFGEKEGVVEENEKELINSIFEFSDKDVKEVMIPRLDMQMVDVSGSFEEILDLVVKSGFSRIPVYEENRDNIVGIVYAKDLLQAINQDREISSVREIMRKPVFVPETKNIDELLRELQKKKSHLAIVIDEYGGTAGIVTIEDIIEEIVGEIQDEYDSEENHIEAVNEREFVVDGGLSIDEINEELELELPEETDIETIAGFVYDLFGKIPREGEQREYEGISFIITKMSRNRIAKIKIIKPEITEEEKNDEEEDSSTTLLGVF